MVKPDSIAVKSDRVPIKYYHPLIKSIHAPIFFICPIFLVVHAPFASDNILIFSDKNMTLFNLIVKQFSKHFTTGEPFELWGVNFEYWM